MFKQKLINIKNKDYTTRELSDKFNISINTIRRRINHGVTGMDIIRKPIKKNKYPSKITIGGNKYTFNELSEAFNVKRATLLSRYRRGKRGSDLIRKAKRGHKNTNTTYITIDNHRYTFVELSNEFNIPNTTLNNRYLLGLRGKDLIKPIAHKDIVVNINHHQYTLTELSKKYHINHGTLKSRYYKGYKDNELIQPVR